MIFYFYHLYLRCQMTKANLKFDAIDLRI
jgi:hypothetical protein